MMKKVKVTTDGKNEISYEILIGNKIYDQLINTINKLKLHKNILIIIDGNVEKLHKDFIKKRFSNYKNKIKYYILKPGESSKSYKGLNKIYSYLIENEFGRDSLVISIGGGVAGDLSGYVAATYMRGIQLVHIPTTLLAAVDSSVGGKTGINFEKKKNLIGSFYQPKLVLIDTYFLSSLPKNEITSGLGEIIKYAFLAENTFYDFVNNSINKIYNLDNKILEEIIYCSVLIKASVVREDEKETWLRKILNFGHTFGHAIESELNFKIKHGEAVTAGIICALYLSNKIGIISKEDLEEFLSLPLKIKLPKIIGSINRKEIYNLMKLDKKTRNGKINFVLTSGIGKTLVDVEASDKDIFYSIEKTKNLIFDIYR